MTAVAAGAPAAAIGRDRRASPVWLRILGSRLLDLVLVIWLAATLAFVAMQLIPGDPLDKLLAGIQDATPEMRAQIAAHYGLDKPVIVQYLLYIAGIVQGDLGASYQRSAPVAQVILSEAPATIELTLWAMAVALLGSAAIALLTSGRRPVVRWLAQAFELIAVSVPSFWLGIVLMTVFSFQLRLLPAFSGNGPASLVLPVVTLAIPLIGVLTQVLRERMEHQLHEPFVTTIRARGVGEGELRTRHLLRHSSLPVLTLGGVIFGSLLTGTAVIETLFARPGVGRLIVTALQDRDIPLVLGFVVLAAIVFIVINTLIELVSPLVDPRLKEAR